MAKRFLAVAGSVAAGGGLGVRLRCGGARFRRCRVCFRGGKLRRVHFGLDTRCGRLRRGHFEELAGVGALHGLSGGHASDINELGFLRVGAVDHVGPSSDRRSVGEVLFRSGRCRRRRGWSGRGRRRGAGRGRDAGDGLLDGDFHAGRAANRRVNTTGRNRRALGSDIGSNARCGHRGRTRVEITCLRRIRNDRRAAIGESARRDELTATQWAMRRMIGERSGAMTLQRHSGDALKRRTCGGARDEHRRTACGDSPVIEQAISLDHVPSLTRRHGAGGEEHGSCGKQDGPCPGGMGSGCVLHTRIRVTRKMVTPRN